jgi:hypothetical protein
MHRIIGGICILIGLAVILVARKLADQFGPEVQPLFNGAPKDRAAYIYAGGVVVVLLGVIRFFWKRKRG